MRKPVEITTPYPSLERVASLYGVSKKRQAELVAIVDALYSKGRPARNGHASSIASTTDVQPKSRKKPRAKAKS